MHIQVHLHVHRQSHARVCMHTHTHIITFLQHIIKTTAAKVFQNTFITITS
jgi:hypothetical protein